MINRQTVLHISRYKFSPENEPDRKIVGCKLVALPSKDEFESTNDAMGLKPITYTAPYEIFEEIGVLPATYDLNIVIKNVGNVPKAFVTGIALVKKEEQQ
jgi:hypothetical protein